MGRECRCRRTCWTRLGWRWRRRGCRRRGRLGFELFDKPNWVGSEFDERVNYQRALEGELEHTIGTLGVVQVGAGAPGAAAGIAVCGGGEGGEGVGGAEAEDGRRWSRSRRIRSAAWWRGRWRI